MGLILIFKNPQAFTLQLEMFAYTNAQREAEIHRPFFPMSPLEITV